MPLIRRSSHPVRLCLFLFTGTDYDGAKFDALKGIDLDMARRRLVQGDWNRLAGALEAQPRGVGPGLAQMHVDVDAVPVGDILA